VDINLANCKTSAQAVTKICYNENTRNLNFRIKCGDLKDLKECVQIIEGYNAFEWKKVNEALDLCASLKRFYGKDNPNNGQDFFEFEVAREGSPAIYIKYYAGSADQLKFYPISGKATKEFKPSTFKKLMDLFQEESLANECDIYTESIYEVCRLWWD